MKLLTIFGTRPEAIKLAPLIKVLRERYGENAKVCVTAQHRHMLDSVLKVLQVPVDYDINIMSPNQTLTTITCKILEGLERIITDYRPQRIIVQGDASSTFLGALAAFYAKIPVTHVEAGLRTYDNYSPWPEEGNRRMITAIADMHCVPTEHARQNLLQEHIPGKTILVTGNTVVDTIQEVCRKLKEEPSFSQPYNERFAYLDKTKKLIFVTCHRRESFGRDIQNICNAIAEIAEKKQKEVEIIFPVHLNPNVQKPVNDILSGISNIHLIDHVDYFTCVYLLNQSTLVMTDSGGIQEETPTLGKPTLVLRNKTERVEGIEAGTAVLVGTKQKNIVEKALEILSNQTLYDSMSHSRNLYGDGTASIKIANAIMQAHSEL